jgi:hypothetical protein
MLAAHACQGDRAAEPSNFISPPEGGQTTSCGRYVPSVRLASCVRHSGDTRAYEKTRPLDSKSGGRPMVHLHDWRHSHATQLPAIGEHPRVVQERLGHSQIRVTVDTC